MKTLSLLLLGMMAISALQGNAQSQIPQNKRHSRKPTPVPTFQIDGPGIRYPGSYQIKEGRSMPLYSVLYLAGGFLNQANQEQVSVVRSKSNKLVTVKIDATDQNTFLTFQVQAGDKVTVSAFSYRPIGDFYFSLRPYSLFRN